MLFVSRRKTARGNTAGKEYDGFEVASDVEVGQRFSIRSRIGQASQIGEWKETQGISTTKSIGQIKIEATKRKFDNTVDDIPKPACAWRETICRHSGSLHFSKSPSPASFKSAIVALQSLAIAVVE